MMNYIFLIKKLLLKIIILTIYFYKFFISIWLGKNCRFYPTCSDFMIKAIKNYEFYGIYIGFKRIIRCNPWIKSGIDILKKY